MADDDDTRRALLQLNRHYITGTEGMMGMIASHVLIHMPSFAGKKL